MEEGPLPFARQPCSAQLRPPPSDIEDGKARSPLQINPRDGRPPAIVRLGRAGVNGATVRPNCDALISSRVQNRPVQRIDFLTLSSRARNCVAA